MHKLHGFELFVFRFFNLRHSNWIRSQNSFISFGSNISWKVFAKVLCEHKQSTADHDSLVYELHRIANPQPHHHSLPPPPATINVPPPYQPSIAVHPSTTNTRSPHTTNPPQPIHFPPRRHTTNHPPHLNPQPHHQLSTPSAFQHINRATHPQHTNTSIHSTHHSAYLQFSRSRSATTQREHIIFRWRTNRLVEIPFEQYQRENSRKDSIRKPRHWNIVNNPKRFQCVPRTDSLRVIWFKTPKFRAALPSTTPLDCVSASVSF